MLKQGIKNEIIISASIVLFNNEPQEIKKAVYSIFNSNVDIILYLVDNSETPALSFLQEFDKKIIYHHVGRNIGFGKAHNIAFKLALQSGSKFHFIVNPDVHFGSEVISKMVDYMNLHPDVGMMMPKILNEDGTIQYLPKLIPAPFSLLIRKLKWPRFLYTRFVNKYELRNVDNSQIYITPTLSGCFTLIRTLIADQERGYDDRFFMYFEDWDLSRRVYQKHKTIYFPMASVTHGYHSGANKNLKLFTIFIRSAIAYFGKWGWLVDKDRELINKRILTQFPNKKCGKGVGK